MPTPAVVVPVKAFDVAKSRLAPALDRFERAQLARAMATRVVAAAGSLPVYVATDDDQVGSWAIDLGARITRTDGLDLDGSVRAAVLAAAAAGHDRLVVAHADLPSAERLDDLPWFGGVTLVPDRHDDGTNVIAFSVADGFEFAYGPGSFRRHLDHVRDRGLPVRIARRPDLQWDVDVPADVPAVALAGDVPTATR